MILKINEYLPFDFSDTILYKETNKFVKIKLSMLAYYRFNDGKKDEMLDYDQVMERYYKGSISIKHLLNSAITITLFDQQYQSRLEEFDKFARMIGVNNFINTQGNMLIDSVIKETEPNLILFSKFKTYKELFDFRSVYISNINELSLCEKTYKERCEILMNTLNSKIDFIETRVKSFYDDCGLILHRFYVMQKNKTNMYHSIFLKNDIIGSNTIVKTGLTYYFSSSNQFKEWLNTKDDNYEYHEVKEDEERMPPKKNDENKDEVKKTTKKSTTAKKETTTKKKATPKKEETPNVEEKEAKKTTTKKSASTKKTTSKSAKKPVSKKQETKKLENGDEVVASYIKEKGHNEDKVTPKNMVTAGDKTCYCYFDIKLTEEAKKTTIISLACVSYDARTFYAEFTDYVKTENTSKKVISSLLRPNNIFKGKDWSMTGNRDEVAVKLAEWLKTITDENSDSPLQMVSDIAHYKFVMLLDLLGKNAPKNMSKCVLDINQDIATSITRINNKNLPLDEFNKDFVPLVEAYNMDRASYVNVLTDFSGYADKMDNCLVSATVIKFIHQYMWGLIN